MGLGSKMYVVGSCAIHRPLQEKQIYYHSCWECCGKTVSPQQLAHIEHIPKSHLLFSEWLAFNISLMWKYKGLDFLLQLRKTLKYHPRFRKPHSFN